MTLYIIGKMIIKDPRTSHNQLINTFFYFFSQLFVQQKSLMMLRQM